MKIFNVFYFSILYQRGVYPPETFERVKKYGLSMVVSTDKGLKSYLTQILSQIQRIQNNY